MNWSNSEVEFILDNYLQGFEVTCPKCLNSVEIHKIGKIGEETSELLVKCTTCRIYTYCSIKSSPMKVKERYPVYIDAMNLQEKR